MKYIRTKDGIFEVKSRRIVFPVIPTGKPRTIFNDNIHEKDIIKQSEDDLTPLCDQFVVVGYYKKRPVIFDTLIEAERYIYVRDCQDKDCVKIKGAIWTDKGIIYVTEKNKKTGRLELL